MAGAGFILAINISVAGLFATAFLLIALYDKSYVAARWLALAYALGMINVATEFVVPVLPDVRLVRFIAYAAFLAALVAVAAGIAHRYRVPVPWKLIGSAFVLSLILNQSIQDMARDSILRMLLYQGPYSLMQAICAGIVIRARPTRTIDIALVCLLALSALHFLSKPFLAAAFGGMGSGPRDYVNTYYALISQSMGAVLSVATGLLMIAIFMRDILSEITARSETDSLSGLFNRRGFEERAYPALAAWQRSAMPAALIICDLDHFKTVNDTHGHASGDKVIEAFSRVLRDGAAPGQILGRIGGEEFAILLPGATKAGARLYAENVRSAFSTLPIAGLPDHLRFTASFGIAEMSRHDTLSDLLRRADMALYEAKRSGRDCIRTSEGAEGMGSRTHRQRRSPVEPFSKRAV